MKSGLEKIFLKLGSFHKLRLHLGVGRWSEKHVVYYIKSANSVIKKDFLKKALRMEEFQKYFF